MQGDTFARIYDTHYPRVFRYLLAKVRKRQEAEDLAAEVFATALDGLGRGSEPRHMGSWLVGIANHLASHAWRRRAIEQALTKTDYLDDEADPEGLVLGRLEAQILRRCLTTLNSEHQQVLLLRIVAGLPAREVGNRMGKTEEAVRSLQLRALKALRRRWMEVNSSDGPRRNA